jgi:hypothetical protein
LRCCKKDNPFKRINLKKPSLRVLNDEDSLNEMTKIIEVTTRQEESAKKPVINNNL